MHGNTICILSAPPFRFRGPGARVAVESFNQRLAGRNSAVESLVCVGLDPDPERLPADLPADADGVGRFIDDVVAATTEFACAFKPNLGFYLALGAQGMRLLERPARPGIGEDRLLIGDGKWGDIGSTVARYARASRRPRWASMPLPASPYMGWEAVAGLSERPDRGGVHGLPVIEPRRRGQCNLPAANPSTCSWRARPPPPTGTRTADWFWEPPTPIRCGIRPPGRPAAIGARSRDWRAEAATWRPRLRRWQAT